MRIVLDIETELFTEEFGKAKTIRGRLKHAPRPRLACVYSEKTKKYRYYTPGQFDRLAKDIRRAGEVITFNGKQFDYLVIRKHLGFPAAFFKVVKSVDLFSILERRAGFMVSLDAAAHLNLGERKKYKGKHLGTASPTVLKKGCQSDVRQTYRLWKLYRDGKLKVPQRSQRGYWSRFDDYDEDMRNSHIPDQCPHCGSRLVPILLDETQMTEGQWAEYNAGTFGTADCPKCGLVDWEM